MAGRRRSQKTEYYFDYSLLFIIIFLVGFGLVMLGSASGAVALYRRGDAFAYLRPQLLYAAMGIVSGIKKRAFTE